MEKKLILYYSYTNNTNKVAEKIQKATGLDICRIETVKPYTGDYNSVVDQGKQEVDSGYKPVIKPLSVNLEDYDTIIRRCGGIHMHRQLQHFYLNMICRARR